MPNPEQALCAVNLLGLQQLEAMEAGEPLSAGTYLPCERTLCLGGAVLRQNTRGPNSPAVASPTDAYGVRRKSCPVYVDVTTDAYLRLRIATLNPEKE